MSEVIVTGRCMYASGNYVNIGSDNGLSPEWPHAIIQTNTDIMSIGPLGIILSETQIKIQ